MRYYIPDLKTCQSSRAFLKTFVDENRRREKKYTRRYWSTRLKWPVGYIDQVVSGKKRPLRFEGVLNLLILLAWTEKRVNLYCS